MSSSDSWTLIGLTILVVLLLFYLSKKMICGSNGNAGDTGGGGDDGRNYITSSGHNHTHQRDHHYHPEYFEEDMSHSDAYHHSCYSEYNNPDPDNPHHQDQNSEHRLNLDYNSNQQIGEDVIMNRPYYHYYPHHHYHNLPHYPSQSVSLRELLEICSREGTGSSSVVNNQPHTFPQPSTTTTTATTTATALPGNYRTNTSPDNQLCHDTSLDTNNAAACDSGLEVSVISDPASSSTPPYHQANAEPNNSIATTTPSATIELTERKKQLIEKQLRTQIVRMIQAEREVRRLAHLLSLQQGFADSGFNAAPAVPASSSTGPGDSSTLDGEHEPYYISNERGSSPNNSLVHSHHPNYSGHNEVILSAHALSSRYPSHLNRGWRSDHHQHNHHLYYEQHPHVTLTQDANSPSSRGDSEESSRHEMPPPPYEDCVASSPS